MRVGFALPQHGELADPDSILAVAGRAEELGYHSLWVSERLLWPVAPRAPYPATADGSLPAVSQRQLTPLEILTFAAAHTRDIALGTSVIVLPLYQPVRLACQLATIDILSRGRLRVGLGNGWSPDEFEAVAVPMARRDRRTEEYLRVLEQIWTRDEVEFSGEFVTVPRSIIRLSPVQKPRPPLYLAAYTPAAMSRVARYADGWNPAVLPPQVMADMFAGIKKMAAEHGRDPDTLALVARANVEPTTEPIVGQRRPFAGSPAQIREDVLGCRDMGVDELIFDVQWTLEEPQVAPVLEWMEALWEMASR